MIRQPPISTRTDPLFPDTPLFRSDRRACLRPRICAACGLINRRPREGGGRWRFTLPTAAPAFAGATCWRNIIMAVSGIITVMERAARKAGTKLRRDFGEIEHLQVSQKGPADFVSKADQAAERTLYDELTHARPDRQNVVQGKRVSVRVDLGGSR